MTAVILSEGQVDLMGAGNSTIVVIVGGVEDVGDPVLKEVDVVVVEAEEDEAEVGVQDVAASVEGDVVEEEGAFISLGLVIDLAQTGKLNCLVHIPTPSRGCQ